MLIYIDFITTGLVRVNEVHLSQVEHMERFTPHYSDKSIPVEEAARVASCVPQAHSSELLCRLLQIELLIVEEAVTNLEFGKLLLPIPQLLHGQPPFFNLKLVFG